MDSFLLLLATCSLIPSIESLTCYKCSRVDGITAEQANLNCLINSTEVLCQSSYDRCYSSIHDASNTIEKGCTSSARCIESNICCTNNFCNAGFATGMRTGYGKPCETQSDCIQDTEDMVCSQAVEDSSLKCQCTEKRHNKGAICKLKSDVTEYCDGDNQCLLYNSFCEDSRCRCADQFYPNKTEESCLLKRPLTDPCSKDMECRAHNSMCHSEMCVCKYGYYAGKYEDHCSGCSRLEWSLLVICLQYFIYVLH
ncbi:hypothetical protein LOTGIDRAFT_153763 [Lottia gigantea]|uniref:EB domain-containing protein n=1 Tax=Lottia gigantea TaxID=225164 RepID=V4A3R1_LOTGI|nr:hypothetical protein LOTGIDRAFT_153763 [Lottia gigantea]ESO91327.1 hypothetical protein LOTGIDRAFT_153763 [Lottia gigantea]